MLFSIVNPSDAYTLETDSFEAAALATLLVGRGQYALEALDDGGKEMPLFLFGGLEEWWTATFKKTFSASVDDALVNPAAVIAAADSVVIGSSADRRTYNAALVAIDDPGKRQTFIDRWNDEKRSSLNDIGAGFRRLAKQLRERGMGVVTTEKR